MSFGKSHYLSRLQTLLVFIILNGMAKTKLAILCCREIVKNSMGDSVQIRLIHLTGRKSLHFEKKLDWFVFLSSEIATGVRRFKRSISG